MAILAVALLLAVPAAAAKRPRKPVKPPPLPGAAAQFATSDGWSLSGHYLPPAPGRYTFLLLHGVGSNSGEWGAFANRLAVEGYGVLAYDGRGHGESQGFQAQKLSWRRFRSTGTDNEWNQMALDVEAALVYLSSQGVPGSSVAFAGASVGANVMLKAAAAHKEAPLAVLLSPGINYRDVLTVNPIRAYGRRPILLAAAQADGYAFSSATLLYNLALPVSGPDQALLLPASAGHGAAMLEDPAVMDAVIGWIRAEEAGQPFRLVTPSSAPAASSPTTRSNP